MKEITKKSRARRYHADYDLYESKGEKVRVYYARPSNRNDEKRWGKEMSIFLDNVTLRLDGRAIQSIKSVLRAAGEIPSYLKQN